VLVLILLILLLLLPPFSITPLNPLGLLIPTLGVAPPLSVKEPLLLTPALFPVFSGKEEGAEEEEEEEEGVERGPGAEACLRRPKRGSDFPKPFVSHCGKSFELEAE